MRTGARWAIAGVVLLAGMRAIASAQVTPDDFARGVTIQAVDGGSILRIVVPKDVYDTVTRPDLGDLRVFNAAGDAVPHTLRQTPPPPPEDAELVSVPSFPLYTRASDGRATTQVRVDREGGTVLEVSNDRSANQVLTAYLIDISTIDDPVAALSLAWQAADDTSFLARVDVQASDNLTAWRTVVPSAALARMQREAFTLIQSDIDLPAVRARYLRVGWPKELEHVTLTAARVRPQGAAPRVERTWLTLTGRLDPRTPGAAVYDTGALLPVDQVDLDFADPADVASVVVRARADDSAAWTLRHSGLFYALTEAGDLMRSAPRTVGRTTDRWWQVETNREGGWRVDRLPRLKVGWLPHELLFVAQGEGPYTLAYGSARAGEASVPVDAVLASFDPADRETRVRDAVFEAPRDLGGPEMLEPPLPYRQLVLWTVLIGAVVVLAAFAMRTLRDTRPSSVSG